MYPYKYSVSLRIWHPTMNPDAITRKLDLEPSREWMAGERRSTLKGDKLKGINKQTYWAAELHREKTLLSRRVPLEDFLTEQLRRLTKVEKHCRNIRKTGGRIEFFIGLFCDKNMGAEFPSSLLAAMGKLGIDVSLDIYPEH